MKAASSLLSNGTYTCVIWMTRVLYIITKLEGSMDGPLGNRTGLQRTILMHISRQFKKTKGSAVAKAELRIELI